MQDIHRGSPAPNKTSPTRPVMKTTFLFACALLLVLTSVAFAALQSSEREALLNAAVQEAKLEAESHKTARKMDRSPEGILKAFKKAPASALAQGEARLLFEDMVKRAERKIMEAERMASSQSDARVRAEALAKELLHTPGSFLTEEEIARIYEFSECADTVPTPSDCGLPVFQKHRSSDGTCNNLNNPTLGAAETPLRRLLTPRYEDGISQLRGFMQSSGSDLYTQGPFSPPNPSPRIVSIGIVEDRPVESDGFTHIIMQWGQFIDHDLTFVPEFESESCVGCSPVESRCAQIPVPFDDRDILVTRIDSHSCHPFRRSLPACDRTTPPNVLPREQLNALTAFIDGSQVYGSNEFILNHFLRDPNDAALLAVSPPIGDGKPNLPLIDNTNLTLCPAGVECFLAGDVRANEQTALTTMHTIWMREHNRVANEIRNLNPQFDAGKVFLTTREIVASEIQKITYKDYLPILIGDEIGMLLGPYLPQGYNNAVDPSIPNSFAAAAYRFGHSQVQPFFDRLDENYNSIARGPLNLIDSFFNPGEYTLGGGTDPILRGLVSKSARSVDEFVTTFLTNHLFAQNASAIGLDLASLNIQRGRDHGLPPYLVWKRWAERVCRVSSDFKNELTKIHLLQTYGGLETVDLWVGGLAEESLPGGLVGATFACIFAKTFSNLRHGDRFYYENNNQSTGIFTEAQTAELERTSLSRIICDNGDNIQNIQPDAFREMNRVSCSDLPRVDLSVFRASLPTFCYMKVANTEHRLVRSISRLWPDNNNFHIERRFEPACMPFACPESGENARPTQVLMTAGCQTTVNPNLPSSLYNFKYFNKLFESDITAAGGIYTSEDDCNSGVEVALTYSCGKNAEQASKDSDELLIQALEKTLNIQQDDSDQEITMDVPFHDPSVSEDLWRIFEDEDNPMPDDGDSKKLIGLLQDILGKLKSAEVKEMSAPTDVKDEELVSELAEALNDIQ